MSKKHRGSQHYAKLDRRRWQWARLKCFEAAGWRCSRCSRPGKLECHHRVPLQHGGPPYDQSNLVCLCKSCHVEEHRQDESPERAAWESHLQYLREQIRSKRSVRR